MTLNYQATLDDIAEPATRHFLRSKTAKRNRIRSTMFGAILMAVAFVFIFRERTKEFIVIGGFVGAMIGAAINFLTYVPTVKKRIRRHIQTENGHRIPNETKYVVEPGLLRCESLGVKIEFSLADLKDVSEDANRIELSFGEAGLCTIPLRAFTDELPKATFLDTINANKAVHPTATRVTPHAWSLRSRHGSRHGQAPVIADVR
jgi:hypothetical protein